MVVVVIRRDRPARTAVRVVACQHVGKQHGRKAEQRDGHEVDEIHADTPFTSQKLRANSLGETAGWMPSSMR